MLWSNLSGKANPACYGGICREATLEQSAVGAFAGKQCSSNAMEQFIGNSKSSLLWGNLPGSNDVRGNLQETVNPACYGGIYREAMFYGVIYREQ